MKRYYRKLINNLINLFHKSLSFENVMINVKKLIFTFTSHNWNINALYQH